MPSAPKFEPSAKGELKRFESQGSKRAAWVCKPDDPDDNRIYVVPAWAVMPVKKKKGLGQVWEKVVESRWLDAMKFEAKLLLVVFVVLFLAWVGLKGFYRTKSEAGIDLTPIHGPNLVPFIR